MAYNQFQKLRDNISAIRIALEHRNGVTAKTEDQAALQAYSGFGGLKAVLFPAGEKQEQEKEELSTMAESATVTDEKVSEAIVVSMNSADKTITGGNAQVVNGAPDAQSERLEIRRNRGLKI